MTPRRTIIGTIVTLPVARSPWTLRAVLAVLLAILLFLSFFPERHRAAVTLTPTDPTMLGLSGTLGQLGAFNSVFGNQTAVEVALKVGRSYQVRDIVARQLDLRRRLNFPNDLAMHRWLEREVTIRSLRGGIIQFETTLKDPKLAYQLVDAYSAASRERLAQIARSQTEYKRNVLVRLVTDASNRLARAKGAYDRFRLQNEAIIPELALQNENAQIPMLEAAIRAKQVELQTARQFGTDENVTVQQIIAQISALQSQLAAARATNPVQRDSLGRAVYVSRRGEQLFREVQIAQSLYDNYMKFLEGTSVEDMTSTASVRVLEPAHVDTARQVNWSFLALAMALALLWAAIEFYRLRPPVGERQVVRTTYA